MALSRAVCVSERVIALAIEDLNKVSNDVAGVRRMMNFGTAYVPSGWYQVFTDENDNRTCQYTSKVSSYPIYRLLAMYLERYRSATTKMPMDAEQSNRQEELAQRLSQEMLRLEARHLPAGFAFSRRPKILYQPDLNCIKIAVWFNHFTKDKGYQRQTEHIATVIPTWDSIRVEVSGRDLKGCKEEIAKSLYACLTDYAEKEV